MIKKLIFALTALIATQMPLSAADQPVQVGVVNFKTCIEQSKMGKKEQAQFESMKKQMEDTLKEKEKTINEIAHKLNDPDYLDSLSPDAEAELKHKMRVLSQEMGAQENQYYQALNQANFKIMQKMHDQVGQAADKVAKQKGLTMVVNQEVIFYADKALDISNDVIKTLDETFDNDKAA